MEKIMRTDRGAGIRKALRRLALVVTGLYAVVMTLVVVSPSEARPIRGPIMRAERRAVRALAVPERPGRPARAEATADRAEAARERAEAARPPMPRAAVPRGVAPGQAAGRSALQQAESLQQAQSAQRSQGVQEPRAVPGQGRSTPQPVRDQAAVQQAGVQQATFESVEPRDRGRAAEPGEDGTFSVLVRPETTPAPAALEPLAFPASPAK
jgi:hypothetical protein